MPAEYQHLVIRMQIEEQRFLTFSKEAGLLWVEENLCDALQVNQNLLLAILAEVKLLFKETKKKLDKYTEHFSDTTKPNSQEDLSLDLMDKLSLPDMELKEASIKMPTHRKDKISQYLRGWRDGTAQVGRNLRTIVLEPRRLSWTYVDQEAIEHMITRLVELNSFLIVLLDDSQKDRLRLVIDNSYRELILVREDVQTLMRVVRALKPHPIGTSEYDHDDISETSSINAMVERENKLLISQQVYFRKLTEIKIQYRQVTSSAVSKTLNKTAQSMDGQAFVFKDNTDPLTVALFNGRRVYVEWRTADGLPANVVEIQMQLLTDLICNQTLDGFRCPPCLGYVRRRIPGHDDVLGAVFESPIKQSPVARTTTLKDLLDEPGPSLSKRINLCAVMADCLYQFHTIGWLHKGLCSQNIVFFQDSPVDLKSPFLIGFQLARPDMINEMSIKPSFDPFRDIYRHPRAQSMVGGSRYRKSYDLYSLAIVLFEIIVWKPIEQIVGIDDLSSTRPRELQAVRDQLTEQDQYLQLILVTAGDAVKEIVELCLCADLVEKSLAVTEDDLLIEVRMQRTMGKDIVGRLQTIARVLASVNQEG